jgi:hypothetical protein
MSSAPISQSGKYPLCIDILDRRVRVLCSSCWKDRYRFSCAHRRSPFGPGVVSTAPKEYIGSTASTYSSSTPRSILSYTSTSNPFRSLVDYRVTSNSVGSRYRLMRSERFPAAQELIACLYCLSLPPSRKPHALR